MSSLLECVLGIYVLYSRKSNLYPGSTPYELVFTHVPKFTDLAIQARPFVFYPVLLIHLAEAVVMTFKLKKHSVPLFSGAWWAWIGSTLIEGITAFLRYVVFGTLLYFKSQLRTDYRYRLELMNT
jgi:hypothetical protein